MNNNSDTASSFLTYLATSQTVGLIYFAFCICFGIYFGRKRHIGWLGGSIIPIIVPIIGLFLVYLSAKKETLTARKQRYNNLYAKGLIDDQELDLLSKNA